MLNGCSPPLSLKNHIFGGRTSKRAQKALICGQNAGEITEMRREDNKTASNKGRLKLSQDLRLKMLTLGKRLWYFAKSQLIPVMIYKSGSS